MKKITLFLLSFLLLFTISGCGKEKKEENPNDENGIATEYTLGDLRLFNIHLVYEEGRTVYTAYLTNPTDHSIETQSFYAVLSTNDQEVVRLLINPTSTPILEPNQTIPVSSEVAFDLEDITSITYEFMKKEG